MPSPDEFIDGIAEGLAKRAAVVRSVPESRMRKQALDASSWGGKALDWAINNPILPGAALGAGVGGLTGYLRSDDDDKDKGRNALMGAMAGTALGGGLGAGAQFLPWMGEGKTLSDAMRKMRGGDKPSSWMLPGTAAAGAYGLGTYGMENTRYGTVAPSEIWRGAHMATDPNANGRALGIAQKALGSTAEGAKATDIFEPQVIDHLVRNDDVLSKAMADLRKQLAVTGVNPANVSVQVAIPATDQMKSLTEAFNSVTAKMDKAPRDVLNELLGVASNPNSKLPDGSIRENVFSKSVKRALEPILAKINALAAAGEAESVTITADHMDRLIETGVRAHQEPPGWSDKIPGWNRKATNRGTPLLDRVPFGKSRWAIPQSFGARTLYRRGLPAAGAAGAYLGSQWLLDSVLGGGGGRGAAAEKAQNIMGF